MTDKIEIKKIVDIYPHAYSEDSVKNIVKIKNDFNQDSDYIIDKKYIFFKQKIKLGKKYFEIFGYDLWEYSKVFHVRKENTFKHPSQKLTYCKETKFWKLPKNCMKQFYSEGFVNDCSKSKIIKLDSSYVDFVFDDDERDIFLAIYDNPKFIKRVYSINDFFINIIFKNPANNRINIDNYDIHNEACIYYVHVSYKDLRPCFGLNTEQSLSLDELNIEQHIYDFTKESKPVFSFRTLFYYIAIFGTANFHHKVSSELEDKFNNLISYLNENQYVNVNQKDKICQYPCNHCIKSKDILEIFKTKIENIDIKNSNIIKDDILNIKNCLNLFRIKNEQ
jgi:hypothetical protein